MFFILRRASLRLWFVAMAVALPLGLSAATKPLLVYYMPWYVAKPYSQQWGWHWTMDHFNPEVSNAAGEREIASWYYPLIGPYDSRDPAVLEYHVLLMKLSGIDGVVVDWYGMDDYLDYKVNNEATAALFEYSRRAGLKFSLCFEDQTIRRMVEGNFIAATNAVEHTRVLMSYLETNYFNAPNCLRWDGKPVLLNFGPQFFKSNTDWESIFSGLTNHPALFTEDERLPLGAGAFNWPPMWLSRAPGSAGVLSLVGLKNYLSEFENKAASWPAFISSAFPRFHDIYQKTGVRDYWGYLGDRGGNTFRETLTRAMTNQSAMVQIVTWNDFGEGTAVEPTREYGYRDLGIIQELRRKYLDPKFTCTTNDLLLATRLFNLREKTVAGSECAPKLDQAFSNIISGELHAAAQHLAEAEKMAVPSKPDASDKR